MFTGKHPPLGKLSQSQNALKSDIEPQQSFNQSLLSSPQEMIFKCLLGLFLAQLTVAQYGAPPSTSSGTPAPAPSAPRDAQGQHNVGIEGPRPDIANRSHRSTFSRMVTSSSILQTSLLKLAILSLFTFQSSFI